MIVVALRCSGKSTMPALGVWVPAPTIISFLSPATRPAGKMTPISRPGVPVASRHSSAACPA